MMAGWRLGLSLAFREFRQLKSLVFLMVINLSWGLTGYLALSTLQSSTREVLQANARKYISADLSTSARRLMTDDEIATIRAAVKPDVESKVFEMFSMVATGTDSRLVEIKAVDDKYPLYGELKLESGRMIVGDSAKEIETEPLVWVYPEILTQLNLKIGDQIELGGLKFKVADVVVDDSTQTFRLSSLAPKIFIGVPFLKKTNLLQFGSTLNQSMLFKVKGNVKEAKDRFLDQVKDPAINATTYLEAGEDTGRFLGYVFDYLGLGALVGVSLAVFGMAALVRSWVQQKIRHYAIYNTLGLQPWGIQKIFIVQLTVMSVATAVVSLALISGGLPTLVYSLREWIPPEMHPHLSAGAALRGFLLIWLGSLAVALPSIMQLRRIPTQQLFSESLIFESPFNWRSFVWWLPIVVGFWILSVREVSSFRLGSFFVLAVVGAYFVLSLIGWLVFRTLGLFRGAWWARQGVLYLVRKPALLSTFLALSIGTLLTTLIPQIRSGLQAELAGADQQTLPALFMFDIQDEQLPDLQKFVQERGRSLKNLSPLIRSRILTVNGKPYERKALEQGFQTREEQDNARMRNRGVNLSYREGLNDSEKIIAGKPFSTELQKDGVIELSLEKSYAERMGILVGDTMRFDIQGVELEGRVVNLREVKWTRFQPNFFILIQKGALDEAPKTWLANLEKMDSQEKNRLQTEMARNFPNVSSVDVERVIAKALDVIAKMTFALQVMALLTWISGLLVLLALLYRQLAMQKWDANLFRLLGADRGDLFRIFQTQFSLLVLASVGFGSLLALVVAYVMATRMFDGIFAVDWIALTGTVGLLGVVSIALTSFFSIYLSRLNPAGVLQEVRL